ncbi:MAG: type I methionyl aminopeptidase [Candidatus Vogelbacteria bacterium]|nr:type I methionyl aminopeptidase [Candidatus Vogelbacteria bacterium]
MSIKLKTEAEIKILREGGRRLAAILRQVADRVKPGISTLELDALARELIKSSGDEPSFLNYRPRGVARPYSFALCVSTNDEVVHGLPGNRILQTGDLASLDLGLKHDNMFTDMAVTVPVGEIGGAAQTLLAATEMALRRGISAARAGQRIGDVSRAIEEVAKAGGYGVVRELGGHGVGHQVHEEPMVPNFTSQAKGPKLKPGMVLALEPMLTLGGGEVVFLPDGYTVKTADGALAAHFEHTILITATGPEILTVL